MGSGDETTQPLIPEYTRSSNLNYLVVKAGKVVKVSDVLFTMQILLLHEGRFNKKYRCVAYDHCFCHSLFFSAVCAANLISSTGRDHLYRGACYDG